MSAESKVSYDLKRFMGIKRDYSHEEVDRLNPNGLRGNVLIQFKVNKQGRVIQPEILDSFNHLLNETILDKVLAIEFEPALQNGRPVEVQYVLPILFK